MIIGLFFFWRTLDTFFEGLWGKLTEAGMYPRWVDWLQAKVHRQRWKAEKDFFEELRELGA